MVDTKTPTTDIDVTKLTPLSPEVISKQATINIGTIGHVAHGKSTVVKAISGVQTVRFKNEMERNITIKLGYANAKSTSAATKHALVLVVIDLMGPLKKITHLVNDLVVVENTNWCVMSPLSIVPGTIFL
ncbi:unnamed protein product [Absidia cylindrospora]